MVSLWIYITLVNWLKVQPLEWGVYELSADIQRERRVELCFEMHNFFDERRWMQDDHLGFDIKGLLWTKKTDGTLSFEEYTVVTRPYFEKHYYLPIPISEIEKAPSMEQNFGY